MWGWIIGGVVIVATVVSIAACRVGAHHLIERSPKGLRGTIRWRDRGPTPLGEKGFTPQGLTWAGGRLLFANSWKDSRSRVYEIEPGEMRVLRTFDMPEEAVHTSGLAWDEGSLWAVDYRSNRAYEIDLEASLEGGAAVVVGSFDTTLLGTSACCLVEVEGKSLLAISDFMRTRRTILVDRVEALRTGTAEGAIEHVYRNGGFSQGLVFARGYLFEAENKWGIDVINKIDLALALEKQDAAEATVSQYAAPSRGVEDLAWDGSALWTSDESVFRFYQGVSEGTDGGQSE